MTEITKAPAKKKTSSSKKKTGTSTKKKKTAATKKKTSSLKLTKAETELVKNFRKCNKLEKQVIAVITEKAAGGFDLGILSNLLK